MKGKEIKYTIDNFSGLLEVKWENLPDNKRIGVYFLYDENKNLIYIGKSVATMRGRLSNHLFVENPSPYNLDYEAIVLERRKRVKYFAYSDVPKNYIDMVERYLICEQQCEFNQQFKYDMTK
jgi:hypothetical protein